MMRLKRAIFHMALCAMLILGGCAVAPQKTLIAEARLAQNLEVGRTTTAQAQAALGTPSSLLTFDSGYQVWLYEYAAPGAPAAGDGQSRTAECVVLFDRDGIVKKIRRRLPQ